MPESGLDQLIETERRLADRLGAAAAAADEIVAAARRAAVEAAQRSEAELAAAADDLAARIATERDGEIAAIRRTAEREMARLQSLPDETITAVAESLLDQAITHRPEDEGR
jgi:hypothetical protein